MQIFLFLIFLFNTLPIASISAKDSKYQYNLAICAIFRNEARFLKEWIEYHRLVGVEHFYLYNNLSNDEYMEVLTPYITSGLVDLYNVEKEHDNIKDWNDIQCNTYTQCIKSVANQVKWLAIIDTDEFICPVRKNNLVEFLKDYEKYSGVCINWQMYGTSNVYELLPGDSLLEKMVWKGKVNDTMNYYVKSIVRPKKVMKCRNPHYVYYDSGHAVTIDKREVSGRRSEKILIDQIRINHYFMRDEKFFYEVKYPRYLQMQEQMNGLTAEELLNQNNATYNQIYDPIMERFYKNP